MLWNSATHIWKPKFAAVFTPEAKCPAHCVPCAKSQPQAKAEAKLGEEVGTLQWGGDFKFGAEKEVIWPTVEIRTSGPLPRKCTNQLPDDKPS